MKVNTNKEVKVMKCEGSFAEMYNFENILHLIEKLANDKAEVCISTTNAKGEYLSGYGHVYGHTETTQNGETYEAAVVGLENNLYKTFGMNFISFFHNVSVPAEYSDLHKSCLRTR